MANFEAKRGCLGKVQLPMRVLWPDGQTADRAALCEILSHRLSHCGSPTSLVVLSEVAFNKTNSDLIATLMAITLESRLCDTQHVSERETLRKTKP